METAGIQERKFIRPRPPGTQTRHLYVANCGPDVGLTYAQVHNIFSAFGPVESIQPAKGGAARVYVSFLPGHEASAAKAHSSLQNNPCKETGDRAMTISFAELECEPLTKKAAPPDPEVVQETSRLGIPGLSLYLDFVSEAEERELLAAVDQGEWQRLAKRRVQHYGFEFQYNSRNVNPEQSEGQLPDFVQAVVGRLEALQELRQPATLFRGDSQSTRNDEGTAAGGSEASLPLDQLTVNEYLPGVGLSPHVDTHSAFQGAILSLSLAGATVMEFRQPSQHEHRSGGSTLASNSGQEEERSDSVCLKRRALLLPPRSLLVMAGEARHAWQHYIPHRKADVVQGERVLRAARRVSLTFRKVRRSPCSCSYPEFCDSQKGVRQGGPRTKPLHELSGWLAPEGVRSGNMEADDIPERRDGEATCSEVKHTLSHPFEEGVAREQSVEADFSRQSTEEAGCISLGIPADGSNATGEPDLNFEEEEESVPDIERRHVHAVYDAIAPHFSATRFARWPKVAAFLESLPLGSLVVDAGCGNGKYLGFNPACFFMGCDISAPLVEIASKRGFDVAVADALQLPYRTNGADAAISIAVLHHLSTPKRRRKAIAELLRVLKEGGHMLITVWAREQEDRSLLAKWTPLDIQEGAAAFEPFVEPCPSPRSSSAQPLGKIAESETLPTDSPLQASAAPDVSTDLAKLTVTQEKSSLPVGSERDVGGGKGQSEGPQEYFVPWHFPYHRVEVAAGAAAVAAGTARRDAKKQALVYERYYHVFVQNELEKLVAEVGGAELVVSFYDKSNWCIVARKEKQAGL